ncbi:MAG: nuclear transport factor 2 family protein [Dermatophilaceae bacterium]
MTDDRLLTQIANFERCIRERDGRLAEKVLDPDYALVLVKPSFAVVPRSSWLGMLPDYVVHSWEVQEQGLDVDGECAAMLQRVLMQATVLGHDRSGLFVISDVWRLRDDEWRVWRRHSTPPSAGRMPGSS